MIVSLEGLPGSGKSTSVKLASSAMELLGIEERSANVPFLADFYSNVERYKFETEICFVLVHYHQYRDLTGPVLLDYSPVKDLVFADMNLREDDYELFCRLYERTVGSCGKPDLTIFLDLDVDLLLHRIALRGRPYEKDFDPEYLGALRAAYERRMPELGKSVVNLQVSSSEGPNEVALAVKDEVEGFVASIEPESP